MENILTTMNLIIQENSNCPICLEQIESQIISELSSCRHIMCEPCFKNMINFSNKCPLCLKDFVSCFYKNGSDVLSEYFITDSEMERISLQKNSVYHGIILN